MIWFLQKAGWELGNFVMLTPALRALHGIYNQKINVFFETNYISLLYKNCSFINILTSRPGVSAKCTTKHPLRMKNESDYQAYHRILVGNKIPMRKPYVDQDITIKLDKQENKKYVAVFHGCYGNHLIQKKNLGYLMLANVLSQIKDKNYIPVILGNQKDYDTFWKNIDLSNTLNYLGKLNIKDTVSILSQCDYFISNDTGLYHVAGALEMTGFVMWTKTDLIKNKSPFNSIKHVVSKECDVNYFANKLSKWLANI